MDVIIMDKCNQNDEISTILPAKMRVRVLVILMLAAAAVLMAGAGVGAAATTWYMDEGGDQTIAYARSCSEKTTVASPAITTRGNVGIDNDTIVVDIKLLVVTEK